METVAPETYMINDFSMGLDWTTNPLSLDPRSLLDAKNVNLNKYRGIDKRRGLSTEVAGSLGSTAPTEFYEYKAPNGTDYKLVATGTTVDYWSGSAWENGNTGLTTGLRYSFKTHQGILYAANGTDANFKAYNTTVYQVGITPPAAAPSVSKTGDTLLIEEDCAVITDWADGDSGNGASTQVTYDSKSTFRFLTTGVSGDLASRSIYPSVKRITAKLFIETQLYFNTLGSKDDDDYFYFTVATGNGIFGLIFDAAEVLVVNGATDAVGSAIQTGATVTQDAWVTVKFLYNGIDPDNRFVQLWIDGEDKGAFTVTDTSTIIPGAFATGAYGSTVACDVYMNYFEAESTDVEDVRSYRYVYCYVRSTAMGARELISNPSDASSTVDMISGGVSVGYVASTDAQVSHIKIYRTLDFGLGGTPTTAYYLVTTVANATTSYTDTTLDDDLTTLVDVTNTVPPMAFFLEVHKDRVFYANCPSEEDGASLVMWSKSGNGESVPSTNYQYFDKGDGGAITGICSLIDYLLVFKENKVAVLEGEFESLYYLSYNIGCIAPWAILKVGDKAIFLSEEGWMMCDGRNIYPISEKIDSLGERGYYSYDQKSNYYAAYLPEKSQILFMINHSSLANIIMVGHLVAPLLSQFGEVPEEETSTAVAWTYHQYDSHTHKAMGNFTDSNGLKKVAILAKRTTNYYMYETESATGDESEVISAAITTGWSSLNVPHSITKVLRLGHIGAGFGGTSGNEQTVTMYTDVDYTNAVDTTTITQVTNPSGSAGFPGDIYTGTYALHEENFKMSALGQYFRWRLTESSIYRFALMNLLFQFRVEGIR